MIVFYVGGVGLGYLALPGAPAIITAVVGLVTVVVLCIVGARFSGRAARGDDVQAAKYFGYSGLITASALLVAVIVDRLLGWLS